MAHNNRPMSIDAMLDMERKEVLALLESKNSATTTSPERVRSASPYGIPRSPVRSMLDIAEEPDADKKATSPTRMPIRSMLDIDTPVPPSPRQQVVRSMLDLDAPAAKSGSNTTPSSPAMATIEPFKSNASNASSTSSHHRSMSDASFKPVDFGPRRSLGGSGKNDRTSEYQFSGMLPHSNSQQMPKRTSQSKRRSGNALSDALRGGDLSGLQLPGDRGRHSSMSGRLGATSKSPHNRLSNRSSSPVASLLSNNKFLLGDGQVVDMSNAYRRLSDANLAFSSGSLAQLPQRQRSGGAGEGRLIKDYLGPDGEHLGSSEEDDDPYSSDDEDRGRKMDSRIPIDDDGSNGSRSQSRSRSRSGRKSLSLLGAAEQERTRVVASNPQYKYRSLIPEPEIKITNTSGQTVKSKNQVHPHTSFDQEPASTAASVNGSDDEVDIDDIKRAQNLSFSMTNILTTPESHRAIRIIYRGEYNKVVQTVEDEGRRPRKYLVATDLSGESTHALEWAVGTVLRDGDTLLAIYCVDEDTGIVTDEGALVPDDPKAMKEQAAALNSVANSRSAPAPLSQVAEVRRPTALHFRTAESAANTPGSSPAPHGRGEWSKAEWERRRAVQDITDRVLRLLRKTKLQVRVVVEVLHCKNPKHLITEVIDLVNPTLVVIGSRGRSALKGVILGSFSNYLVTKSSVPVMVARKRLRKQSKYKKTTVRQVNNLSNPAARSLANAKID